MIFAPISTKARLIGNWEAEMYKVSVSKQDDQYKLQISLSEDNKNWVGIIFPEMMQDMVNNNTADSDINKALSVMQKAGIALSLTASHFDEDTALYNHQFSLNETGLKMIYSMMNNNEHLLQALFFENSLLEVSHGQSVLPIHLTNQVREQLVLFFLMRTATCSRA